MNCKLVNYDLTSGLDQKKYSGGYIDPYFEEHKQNRTQSATYKFIKKNVPLKGKMLDIGCGNGKLLLLAKTDGWSVNGLELSESYAAIVKEKFDIKVEIEDFLKYDKTSSYYDVVVLKHVLEHLSDSRLAMTKINNLLKVNGYGIFEFPNIESVEFKIKRVVSKIKISKKKYREDYVPGHCNEFCKDSFKYLLKLTGFKLVHWELYSNKNKHIRLLSMLNIGSKARVLVKKANSPVNLGE